MKKLLAVILICLALVPSSALAGGCELLSFAYLAKITRDSGKRIPRSAQKVLSKFEVKPRMRNLMHSFEEAGDKLGYSPQLTAVTLWGYCVGLDINHDFRPCDPVQWLPQAATQADMSRAMTRSRMCFMSIARETKK